MATTITTRASHQRRWALALTAVASLIVALDALVVSTALASIREALGATPSQLGWTVDAYTLSFAVLLMAAAVVGDRLGRRRVFVAGLGVFTVASGACALAPGIAWLIAARAVQGAGAAMIMPMSLALLGAAFAPPERGRALGVYSAVTGLSTVAGPVIGGVVTQGLAWQWIFWLNVPVGVAALTLAPGRIAESRGANEALDVPGLALLTGAALALVWGLVRAGDAGWGSFEATGTLVAGLVLAACFVGHERRRRNPLIPLRLFASRAFAAGNAAMFFLNATLFGSLFVMAQFQQIALGQDALHAGLRLLPWGAAMFVVASRSGTLSARFGAGALIAGGLALQAVGLAWLAAIAAPGMTYAAMLAPMACAGAGFAAAIPAIQATVLGAVAPPGIGRASGTLGTLRQLGGALGIALTVTVFAAAGGYGSPRAFSDGFAASLAVCAALSLAGALAALLIPSRLRVAARAARPSASGR